MRFHLPGVPNVQLVKENVSICAQYNNQSVAEQNSVDICWNLLMQPEFKDLRAVIYCSTDELKRFRQLVVNVSWMFSSIYIMPGGGCRSFF